MRYFQPQPFQICGAWARVGRTPQGYWIGMAAVPTPGGYKMVQEVVDERLFADLLGPSIGYDPSLEPGYPGWESAGFFDFIGDAVSTVKNAVVDGVKSTVKNAALVARSIVSSSARKELIRKLGNGIKKVGAVAKKVYEHPIFAGIVTGVSVSVPGGAVLGATYALSRAAMGAVDAGIKGDLGALANAGNQLLVAATNPALPGEVRLNTAAAYNELVNAGKSIGIDTVAIQRTVNQVTGVTAAVGKYTASPAQAAAALTNLAVTEGGATF